MSGAADNDVTNHIDSHSDIVELKLSDSLRVRLNLLDCMPCMILTEQRGLILNRTQVTESQSDGRFS